MLTTEKLMSESERGALSDYIGTISINWDSPRPTSHMETLLIQKLQTNNYRTNSFIKLTQGLLTKLTIFLATN